MSVPGSAQDPQQTSPKRSITRTVIGALTAVVAIAAAALAVVFFTRYSDERDTAAARSATVAERDHTIAELTTAGAQRETARKSACDYITAFTTYDYTNLDGFFTAARDGSTGDWLRQITDVEAGMRDVMAQAQVHSASTGSRCGIEGLDAGKASVIASVGHAVSNAADPEPQTAQLSIVIELAEQGDGRWLVNNMDAPGLLAPR